LFGIDSAKPKIPGRRALENALIEVAALDDGLIQPTTELDFVDLGGKGSRPRRKPELEGTPLGREEALEWLNAGFTPAEIAEAFPGSNMRTIAAWAAHRTMGTYKPPSE
jgi:hypothetical protein